MKKTYVIGLVFVIALGIGAYTVKAPTPSGLTAPGFGAANATEAGEIDTSSILEMTLGAEDAAIQMTEYASYTCPHCRTFHKDVFQKLKADYIDTGKLRFTYREIYFDRYGLWGSIVNGVAGLISSLPSQIFSTPSNPNGPKAPRPKLQRICAALASPPACRKKMFRPALPMGKKHKTWWLGMRRTGPKMKSLPPRLSSSMV